MPTESKPFSTTDPMFVWNSLCKTDSNYTKPIKGKRYKGDAIDPQYTVRKMTELFGVVGVGWGYNCSHSIIPLPNGNVMASVDLTVWIGLRENSFGPWRGLDFLQKGDYTDDDAAKKATTDALTKALSHVGCSADVFLGEFDSSKYASGSRNDQGTGKPSPAAQEVDVTNIL